MRQTRDKILKESKDRREKDAATLVFNKQTSLETGKKEDLTTDHQNVLTSQQSFNSVEVRSSPDFKKREEEMAKVKEYKEDFLNYFEMKLTKAGAEMGDPSAAASMAALGT